jgi:hypothetical protein
MCSKRVKKPAPRQHVNLLEEVPSGGMPNTPTSASLMAPDTLSGGASLYGPPYPWVRAGGVLAFKKAEASKVI